MAEKTNKNPLNAPGKYYNDLSCIDCDLCRNIAPRIFVRDDKEGLTYALRQPANEHETTLVHEAIDACPTESIGNDG